MQGEAWVELIKRIPDTYHDNLVAVTSTGAEIMVQRVMRLEKDFMVMRGRPAGSTDQARIVLMPWDQVNHIAFQKPLPEPEVQQIFGNGEAAPPVPEQPEQRPEAVADESSATPPLAAIPNTKKEPAASSSAAAPPAKPAPVSKSILLARLRARMANDLPKG